MGENPKGDEPAAELFENVVVNRRVAADGPGSFAPSEVDEEA